MGLVAIAKEPNNIFKRGGVKRRLTWLSSVAIALAASSGAEKLMKQWGWASSLPGRRFKLVMVPYCSNRSRSSSAVTFFVILVTFTETCTTTHPHHRDLATRTAWVNYVCPAWLGMSFHAHMLSFVCEEVQQYCVTHVHYMLPFHAAWLPWYHRTRILSYRNWTVTKLNQFHRHT